MRFWESFHDNHSEYTINNKFIEQKSFHKDLGITFTNNLNCAKHISAVCAKVYQTLGLLRRTFKTNCVEAKNNYTYHWCAPKCYIVLNYGDLNY